MSSKSELFAKSGPRTELRMRSQALSAALVRVEKTATRDALMDARKFLEKYGSHLLERFDEDFSHVLGEDDPSER